MRILPFAAWAALAACTIALTGCGGATAPGADPTPLRTTTTIVAPTTTVPATTSTTYAPVTPETSAAGAVDQLLATWAAGDRVSAARVATPSVVAALFALPARVLQSRGCSDGQPPLTCSYADRSAAGNFYDISASQTAAGDWYVSQIQITPIS